MSDKPPHASESEAKKRQEEKPTVDASRTSTEASSLSFESGTEKEKPKKSKKQQQRDRRDPRIYELDMDDPKWLEEEAAVQEILQYKFRNRLLLREAMYTHRAHNGRLENGVLLLEANFGLAQHGDAVLRQTLTDCWFDQLEPGKKRTTIEAMQKRLAIYITDTNLEIVAEKHGITELILKWYPRDGLKHPGKKRIATTIEALIGAVERDSGKKAVVRKVLSILLDVDLVGKRQHAWEHIKVGRLLCSMFSTVKRAGRKVGKGLQIGG